MPRTQSLQRHRVSSVKKTLTTSQGRYVYSSKRFVTLK